MAKNALLFYEIGVLFGKKDTNDEQKDTNDEQKDANDGKKDTNDEEKDANDTAITANLTTITVNDAASVGNLTIIALFRCVIACLF